MTDHTHGDETAEHATRDDAATPERVERLAREYAAEGRPFARVTVVRREPPVSAHVGDRALVTLDGDLVGWIGGVACAQSVAIREAKTVLRRGEPMLVGLAPDPSTIERAGLEAFPMTCHSQGTIELFIEPVTPVPRLVVVGNSPTALALVDMASQLSYDVTVVGEAAAAPARDVTYVSADVDVTTLADEMNGASWVVVASMGAFDERGVEAALATGVPYVGLVASDRRAGEVAATVAERSGRDPDAVRASLTSPAGVDIGAQTPEEIAVSILAELVAVRRGETDRHVSADAVSPDQTEADPPVGETTVEASSVVTDPVCGMDVTVGEAAATVEYEGTTYHFCGQGCADAFADEPERFVTHAEP